MNLKAILFDVDGTLAETEELHREAFNRTFQAAGLPWHWDRPLYGELLAVTGGKERLRHFIDSHARSELGADPTPAIARLHAAKTDTYTGLVEAGALQFRPGFRELITAARQAGIRLGIATTTSLPNVSALLRAALGAEGERCFEVIAAGDSVARKKPAPDIYLSALAQLGLGAQSCMAVEDSAAGLRSARSAGIPTLVVRSAYTRHQSFEGAALVLDSLEELPSHMHVPSLLEAAQSLHTAALSSSASAAPAAH
jgi:HAD superfamily hydrolase (TIGR01509 family)